MDVVYFIKAGGFVKIGKSTAKGVKQRVEQMQTGCPYELEVLGYIAGGYELESSLHSKFDENRYRGEWFKLSTGMIEYISLKNISDIGVTPETYTHLQQEQFKDYFSFAKDFLKLSHHSSLQYANERTENLLAQDAIEEAVSLATFGVTDNKKDILGAMAQAIKTGNNKPLSLRDMGEKSRIVRKADKSIKTRVVEEAVSDGIFVAIKQQRTTKYQLAGETL